MLNKEEITYNCKSLVSTLLSGKKEITELRLEVNGDNVQDIIPCNEDNCGDVMAKILIENNNKYKTLKLVGKIKEINKVLGELDIL